MPNIRWLIALVTRIHRWLYRVSRGWVGGGLRRKFLLLTHVGRKSGLTYETPLLCIEDGDRLVVVASNGGDARDPSWWLNLKAQPRAVVQFRTRRWEVVARRAEGSDRARLWSACVASYRSFEGYAERTGREIPVVVLSPTAADGSTAG